VDWRIGRRTSPGNVAGAVDESMTGNIEIKCARCGFLLTNEYQVTNEYQGPCPKCGEEARERNVIGDIHSEVTLASTKQFIHEFYEKNKRIKFIVDILLVLSFLVSSIGGWIGLVIGAIIGIISYFLTPYAVTKVREIRSG